MRGDARSRPARNWPACAHRRVPAAAGRAARPPGREREAEGRRRARMRRARRFAAKFIVRGILVREVRAMLLSGSERRQEPSDELHPATDASSPAADEAAARPIRRPWRRTSAAGFLDPQTNSSTPAITIGTHSRRIAGSAPSDSRPRKSSGLRGRTPASEAAGSRSRSGTAPETRPRPRSFLPKIHRMTNRQQALAEELVDLRRMARQRRAGFREHHAPRQRRVGEAAPQLAVDEVAHASPLAEAPAARRARRGR